MPRPPLDGVSRCARVVRALRYLADHGGSADSEEIRDGVPAYAGESGHRKWRRDLKVLRERGLVASKTPGEEMSSRVELARLRKPERLFLTLDEHDALAQVEDRFRNIRPTPSPLLGEGGSDLHDLARLTRYLEERPGWELTYAQVEEALRLRRERLTQLLEQITVESENDQYIGGPVEHPALDWIEHESPEVHPPDGFICNLIVAARLGAEVFDPKMGTGQLRFFAYSAAEVDDRLELIGHALREPDLSADQRRLLVSVRRKLREWRGLLPVA